METNLLTEEDIKRIKSDPKKKQAADHLGYRDIWDHGLEKYPFARARIEPIIYEVPDGAKVLDVGVNSGEVIKYLQDKKGCDVWGVDISENLIEICHKKGLKNTYVCDADRLPFEDNTFDVVLLCEVLEHFDEPVPYLKEIARVLKKDGFLLGSSPHANIEAYMWDDDRKHHQCYTEEGIKKDLYDAFKKVELRILNGTEFNPSMATSHLANLPCEILFKAGWDNLEPWDEQYRKSNLVRVWMGPTQLQGVVYYRMKGYADKMEKYGVEVAHDRFKYSQNEEQSKWQDRLTNDNDSFYNRNLAGLLGFADMSIWQIVGSKRALAFLYSVRDPDDLGNSPLKKKPLITEVDDWLFDLPAYNVGSNPFKPNSEPEWVAYRQIALSDYIICSTQFIKDGLLEIFPDKKIYVIPNSIDFDLWTKPVEGTYPKEDGIIRIGFTGCGNHNGDLDLIKRPLAKLMEEFPNVELMTYLPFEALKGLPRVTYTNKWVNIDEYPDEVRRWKMDIGIAPLRDNNFNRAKSNLRWLEYSAMGVPSIVSDVYPFTNSVTNNKTGIICQNNDLAWYEGLRSLIIDQGKRTAIGEAAHKEVKRKFNMNLIAKKYAQVLRSIKCSGPNSTQKLGTSSEIRPMIDGLQVSSTIEKR